MWEKEAEQVRKIGQKYNGMFKFKCISNYIKLSGLLFQLENRDCPHGYKIFKNSRRHI